MTDPSTDMDVSARVAAEAGQLLLRLRESHGPVDDRESADALRKAADRASHELIVARLASWRGRFPLRTPQHRPGLQPARPPTPASAHGKTTPHKYSLRKPLAKPHTRHPRELPPVHRTCHFPIFCGFATGYRARLRRFIPHRALTGRLA